MKVNFYITRRYSIVRPFIYKKSSIINTTIHIFILLILQLICLGIYKSFDALFVIGGCTLASLFVYFYRLALNKEHIYDIFGYLIQGIFIGMFLPESYPPVVAAFITLFVVWGVKSVAINPSNIWVNTVAFSVIIAWFIGKQFFPDFLITAEMLEMKNPSLTLIQNGTFPVMSLDSTITGFLNNTVFGFLKVSVPEGYISFLWDSHSVIPAFRFNLLTIFSSIVLFSDDSIEVLIPSIFLLVYAALVRLFAPMFFGGTFNSGDIILALFSSGTLFVSLFMLQWFNTIPSTGSGKVIYAVLCGVIAFILVGAGTSPIGMIYTILIGNLLSVIIKTIETKKEIFSVKKAGTTE